jgi:hypothetical protein
MKKINQYLPFILWSICTVILTIVAFVFLPVLLLWEIIANYFRKLFLTQRQVDQESSSGYDICVDGLED